MPLLQVERVFISLVFGISGLTKLFGLGFELDAFERWGFPTGFMYFTGVLELAGALAMWMRKLAPFAALCLAGLTLGALAVRAWFGEWPAALGTAVVLVVVAHYAWRRRHELFPR